MVYFNQINEKNNMFSKLPLAIILTKKNGKELFKEAITKIYYKEDEKELKEIVNYVYYKINTKYKELSWSQQEYSEFKKNVSKIDSRRFEIVSSTIKKCLLTPNKKIYETLVLLSKQVDWYPIKERIKDNENKYIYIDKKIEVIDCFYIINNLDSYIEQYISGYAREIIVKYIYEEDIDNIIKQEQNNFLKGFEERFKYIKENTLFSDIYIHSYNNSLKRLISEVRAIKHSRELTKKRQQINDNYVTRTNHVASLRKHRKIYQENNKNKNYYIDGSYKY